MEPSTLKSGDSLGRLTAVAMISVGDEGRPRGWIFGLMGGVIKEVSEGIPSKGWETGRDLGRIGSGRLASARWIEGRGMAGKMKQYGLE